MKFPDLHKKTLIMILNSKVSNVPWHWHEYIEFVYVRAGEAVERRANQTFHLRGGDFFVISPGIRHKYETVPDCEFRISNFIISPRLFDSLFDKNEPFCNIVRCDLLRFEPESFSADPCMMIFHDDDGSVLQTVDAAYAEYSGMKNGSREALRGYVVALLVKLLRRVPQLENFRPHRGFIDYITDCVGSRYAERLRLSDICDEIHYSLPYVSKSFSDVMGMTFSEYLQLTRVRRACSLLSETELSVAEIGQSVGYSNRAFFHRIFKELTGVSPAAYRKIY